MSKLDFTKSIFENRQLNGAPLLVAHRGVCGANIPCNTLAAFKIAIDCTADVIELDVSRSLDGELFVFHPGTEPIFLKTDKKLSEMTSDEIKRLRLFNQDDTPTSYGIPTLMEAFELLRNKVYINVDKFWTDVEGISDAIRKAGVAHQVIVKSFADDGGFDELRRYASDLMFMPIVRKNDGAVESLIADGMNVIGAEVLFADEYAEVISDEYISAMHERGLLLWANSIVYDEREVISAYHTDDISLTDSPERGWGWLIDKGIDLIQTDWILPLRAYMGRRQ